MTAFTLFMLEFLKIITGKLQGKALINYQLYGQVRNLANEMKITPAG
jgi:hypothetical protein